MKKKDLLDFSNIGEYAPELGEKFFDYYNLSTNDGKLSEKEM